MISRCQQRAESEDKWKGIEEVDFFLSMTKGKRGKRKDEGVVLQGDQAHFKNHSIAGEVDWLCLFCRFPMC